MITFDCTPKGYAFIDGKPVIYNGELLSRDFIRGTGNKSIIVEAMHRTLKNEKASQLILFSSVIGLPPSLNHDNNELVITEYNFIVETNFKSNTLFWSSVNTF